MALRLRKDIKKSSYYVWFLGAKESHGLRGEEYILPVIRHLIERERDIEPFKVTLQVSHKGLKIIQNIVTTNTKNSKPKNETIKHFIPHNTITCVLQHEDIVACILLLFNPVTKCPLHVHAYRCDSLETATLLKNQLQILIERPDNQKKLLELEQRLKLKNSSVNSTNTNNKLQKVKKFDSSLGSSDNTSGTTSSARESESSDEHQRFGSSNERIANLYDSLAAELRQKLGKNDPILLPPRDYDTVHRQKGNLTGIELRRSLNSNIVGMNGKNQQTQQTALTNTSTALRTTRSGGGIESSGGSSGIGSDHAPSPDGKEDVSSLIQDTTNRYVNAVDNQSSSDEDWNIEPMESTLYLMHEPSAAEQLSRMRIAETNRLSNQSLSQSPGRGGGSSSIERRKLQATSDLSTSSKRQSSELTDKKYNKYLGNESPPTSKYVQHNSSNSPKQKYFGEINYHREVSQPENGYKTLKSDRNSSKYSDGSPKMTDRYTMQKSSPARYSHERLYDSKAVDEFEEDPPSRYYNNDSSPIAIRNSRRAEDRQRSPSPKHDTTAKHHRQNRNNNDEDDLINTNVSPKDRFKDAKEKFLLLEKQRLEEQERLAVLRRSTPHHEKPISPQVNNTRIAPPFPRNWGMEDEFDEKPLRIPDKNMVKRHESINMQKKYDTKEAHSRYSDKDRYYPVEDHRYEDDHNRYDYKDDKIRYFNRYNEQTSGDHHRYTKTIQRAESPPGFVEDNTRYTSATRHRTAPTSGNHPKPAPRNSLATTQQQIAAADAAYDYEHHHQVPLERYRELQMSGTVDASKRRSMYNVIEDEHKRTSNEIAKELKRRSYLENSDRYFNNDAVDNRYYREPKPTSGGGGNNNGYVELNDHERYPGLDRDDYRLSKSTIDLDKAGRKSGSTLQQQRSAMMAKSTLDLEQTGNHGGDRRLPHISPQKSTPTVNPGYRHSYAEPKLRIERMGGKKLFPDMLHRTNSSVSNSGRVGIASIHPY